MLELSAPRLNP